MIRGLELSAAPSDLQGGERCYSEEPEIELITSGQRFNHLYLYIRGNRDIFSWAPKSLQTVTAAMKLKSACSLEEKT